MPSYEISSYQVLHTCICEPVVLFFMQYLI
jgi:hypothetical protein